MDNFSDIFYDGNENSKLKMIGEQQNGLRVGKWCYFYKNTKIGGGKYNQNGLEIGFWRQFNLVTFQKNCQIFFQGCFENGKRINRWKIYFRQHMIGGGSYTQDKKDGFWREIHEQFFNGECQYLLEGIYKNGTRVGYWKILINEDQIGGGEYDQNEVKIGKWIELCEETDHRCGQIVQSGLYHNGIKTGVWINYYKDKEIGRGEYNENGLKQGKWKDSFFDFNNKENKIISEGFYNLGVRNGNWIIYLNNNQIGGGDFNKQGQKNGFWIEVDEKCFANGCLLLWKGNYVNGKKINLWSILYQNIRIGGGQFNNFGQKVGLWKDLNSNRFQNDCQVIWEGQYENGIKIGRWLLQYDQYVIGCGKFDKSGIKQGFWKDINEQTFRDNCTVVWEGQYLNGLRVGEWKLTFQGDMIGEGEYNQKGQKIGKWKEINEKRFKNDCQIFWEGHYFEGQRIGRWTILFENQIIGGGLYNSQGTKTEVWKEINEKKFEKDCQLIWEGSYKNGVRIGEWNVHFQGQTVFGGQYDKNGKKNGKWSDINEDRFKNLEIFMEGQYCQGIRIGKWDINHNWAPVGGGEYNSKGQKIGFWKDLDEEEQPCIAPIIWQGIYEDGKRVGLWKIFDEGNLIGVGQYNSFGKKIGYWKEINPKTYLSYEKLSMEGSYDNGIRTGIWSFKFNDQKIGGGEYNQQGEKVGQWADINENNYDIVHQVIWKGEYEKNIKIGQWHVYLEDEKIGGGRYNEQGMKIGIWKDIHENMFNYYCKLVWEGNYQNGKKVGKWRFNYDGTFGGGTYNDQEVKIDFWTDIYNEKFNCDFQIYWEGYYEEGIKVGKWQLKTNQNQKEIFEFNEKGLKNGTWCNIIQENNSKKKLVQRVQHDSEGFIISKENQFTSF